MGSSTSKNHTRTRQRFDISRSDYTGEDGMMTLLQILPERAVSVSPAQDHTVVRASMQMQDTFDHDHFVVARSISVDLEHHLSINVGMVLASSEAVARLTPRFHRQPTGFIQSRKLSSAGDSLDETTTVGSPPASPMSRFSPKPAIKTSTDPGSDRSGKRVRIQEGHEIIIHSLPDPSE